jgi:hypothetical protein
LFQRNENCSPSVSTIIIIHLQHKAIYYTWMVKTEHTSVLKKKMFRKIHGIMRDPAKWKIALHNKLSDLHR